MSFDITRMEEEIRRTHPDYIVHVPGSLDGSTGDGGNEHFLVFDGPDGSLMAVWTQSTYEGQPDHRIVFSRSTTEGMTWTRPKTIAGPGKDIDPKTGKGMTSWGFPLISKSGRIYVLYNKQIGLVDTHHQFTGVMAGKYSDDNGETWSAEDIVPMPKSKWDDPDPAMPGNWIVWQKPERLSEGKYFAGFTRWLSTKVRKEPPKGHYWAWECVVEFMRFENVDNDPAIRDLKISYFAENDAALRVEYPFDSTMSVVQEPSLVKLPDGRLFCAMRTFTGHPYYAISADAGKTWSKPEVLRYNDESVPMLHPISPSPIYEVEDGVYALFIHNHNGNFGPWTGGDAEKPGDSLWHRRPIWILRGTFMPNAKQPLHFSPPRFLMDNDGVALGFGNGRTDLAMYASCTRRNGNAVLWYPERKFFLLGKKLKGLY
ncbi:MAG: sialidase family protein [Spirochaetota bacterium]